MDSGVARRQRLRGGRRHSLRLERPRRRQAAGDRLALADRPGRGRLPGPRQGRQLCQDLRSVKKLINSYVLSWVDTYLLSSKENSYLYY